MPPTKEALAESAAYNKKHGNKLGAHICFHDEAHYCFEPEFKRGLDAKSPPLVLNLYIISTNNKRETAILKSISQIIPTDPSVLLAKDDSYKELIQWRCKCSTRGDTMATIPEWYVEVIQDGEVLCSSQSKNTSTLNKVIKTRISKAQLSGEAEATTLSNLSHRWSFTDLTDSVGGASISLHGKALIDGSGSLTLPGSSAPRQNYASVAIGSTISTAKGLTVETWATTSINHPFVKLWMFGNSTAPHCGMDFSPVSPAITNTFPGIGISADYRKSHTILQGPNVGTTPLIPGTPFFTAVVFDDRHDLISYYVNGTYQGSNFWEGHVSDLGSTSENYFGAAVGFSDNDYHGSINELRIWNSALTSSDIAVNAASGPDSIGIPKPRIQPNAR